MCPGLVTHHWGKGILHAGCSMRIVYRPTLLGGAVLSFQCWSTQEFVGNSIRGQLCLDRLWLLKDWGDWSLLVLLYNLCVCVFKPRTLHALARVTLLSHNPRLRVWILMSLKGACVGGTDARKMIVDSDTFRCWLLVRDPRTWVREGWGCPQRKWLFYSPPL